MLPVSGPVARKAADDALLNVGVSEDGPPYNNSGQWVDTYLAAVDLGPGYPWCAAFVEYREIAAAHALGVSLPGDFPRGGFAASAANWAQWGKDHGLFFPAPSPDQAGGGITPQKGDLCCFDIAGEGGIHHIGIVQSAGLTGFVSVEGNAHEDGDPIRDGYCVAIRHRTYGNLGSGGGFVRLRW